MKDYNLFIINLRRNNGIELIIKLIYLNWYYIINFSILMIMVLNGLLNIVSNLIKNIILHCFIHGLIKIIIYFYYQFRIDVKYNQIYIINVQILLIVYKVDL